jgi:hypothetical protein
MSNKDTQLDTKKESKELLDSPNPIPQSKNDLPNKRFTTLINPNLLSQIKLISYFTNKTLSQSINDSISLYVKDFESKNDTKIQSIINLKNSQF